MKTANLLEVCYRPVSFSLRHRPRPINLILHEYSSTSNAFVAWAPRRMEFYTVPPQASYAQPWIKQLALHEFRHVVQISKLNQGMTRVISCVFGQQGTAGILGLYVPLWFLEGDAVSTETALSFSGRGRNPAFEMTLRAQLLGKGMYSYDKAVYGSYKDRVPNRYVLGYHLVAGGRREFGPGLWETTLNTVGRKAWMITPFSRGIRKGSGMKKIPFYEHVLNTFAGEWQQQDDISPATCLSPSHRSFTSYLHPHLTNTGHIIALRKSIADITRIVSIDSTGSEKVLHTPGRILESSLSYANGRICWAETETDPRWHNREYAVINILCIASGKVSRRGKRSRYFAPALSPTGDTVAAVNVEPGSRASLVLLDTEDGTMLKRVRFGPDQHITTPSWSGDGKYITALLLDNNGKRLIILDIRSGRKRTVIPPTYKNILNPFFAGKYIYFEGPYSGISNIYAVDTAGRSIRQVSSAKYGHRYPFPSGKDILLSDYTPDGFRIAEISADPSGWIPLEKAGGYSAGLANAIAQQEKFNLDTVDIPGKRYSVKRFRRGTHLFDIHSWAPLSIRVSTLDVQPGVSFLSQNQLSTSTMEAGYAYDLTEETGKYYVRYSYEGFYPVLDLHSDHGKRRGYTTTGDSSRIDYLWNETSIGLGMRLPLTFTRGRYYLGLQPSVSARQKFRKMDGSSRVEFGKENVFSSGMRLYAYRLLKRSSRDLYPAWGQTLDIRYHYTPFDDMVSSLASGELVLYFPGILKNQGLKIYAGIQERHTGYYSYSNAIRFPRGFSNIANDRMLSLRSTYMLPVVYPDLSLGPVLYLQRIKLGLFCDYALAGYRGKQQDYKSTGIEITGDAHILRFIAPFELGVRVLYHPGTKYLGSEFLFAVGFDSFYIGGK
ncbi:MAG: hypothetical protein R6T99_08460 [Bacteroidales bacterium]